MRLNVSTILFEPRPSNYTRAKLSIPVSFTRVLDSTGGPLAGIPRQLLTVVCEAQLKIIDSGPGTRSFVNNVDEFNGNVYWPPRVNTKSRAMKAQKFQHGKTRASVRREWRKRGTNGWEGDARRLRDRERDRDSRRRERRKGRGRRG